MNSVKPPDRYLLVNDVDRLRNNISERINQLVFTGNEEEEKRQKLIDASVEIVSKRFLGKEFAELDFQRSLNLFLEGILKVKRKISPNFLLLWQQALLQAVYRSTFSTYDHNIYTPYLQQ